MSSSILCIHLRAANLSLFLIYFARFDPAISLLFSPIHAPAVLDTLPPEAFIGQVDPDTVPRLAVEPTAEEKRIAAARAALPHPSAALNLDDIEALAYQVLTATAWAYYSSAGDDEQSISLFSFRQMLTLDTIHGQQIEKTMPPSSVSGLDHGCKHSISVY
jgi:hypothetical protein